MRMRIILKKKASQCSLSSQKFEKKGEFSERNSIIGKYLVIVIVIVSCFMGETHQPAMVALRFLMEILSLTFNFYPLARSTLAR